MTPKEKAIELYEKFFYSIPSMSDEGQLEDKIAKQCALIAVAEIINSRPCIPSPIACDTITDCFIQAKKYWEEVKTEIEKL